MKILIASHSAVTLMQGGIHTQAVCLQRELVELGHQAELFDPWRDYQVKDYDWLYLVGAHIGTLHLARSLKQAGVRLAVSPVFFSRHRPAALRRRIEWVGHWRRLARLESEAAMTAEICRLADLVLPNTNAEMELIIDGLGTERFRVRLLPNGADERYYSATPDAFVHEHGRGGFILYVGHIGHGRKGLLDLIEVMPHFNRSLVVVGKVLHTDYARQCQAAILKLKDWLIIPGLDHNSEMLASAYAACDTFCLPSMYETPGLAALEAGLAGAKVVITRAGGTHEYFGPHARYVAHGDREGLRHTLERSVSADKTPALREHIYQNYLWSHAAGRLIECLEEKDEG